MQVWMSDYAKAPWSYDKRWPRQEGFVCGPQPAWGNWYHMYHLATLAQQNGGDATQALINIAQSGQQFAIDELTAATVGYANWSLVAPQINKGRGLFAVGDVSAGVLAAADKIVAAPSGCLAGELYVYGWRDAAMGQDANAMIDVAIARGWFKPQKWMPIYNIQDSPAFYGQQVSWNACWRNASWRLAFIFNLMKRHIQPPSPLSPIYWYAVYGAPYYTPSDPPPYINSGSATDASVREFQGVLDLLLTL